MFIELITKNRSYRRFYEDQQIERDNLLTLIEYARLTPSGANKQTLKYIITNEKAINEKVYLSLAWAGYLPDWAGPEPGERPSAYIVILQNTKDKMVGGVDHGIAAQSILLGAAEMGLGGCIIGNIKRSQLQETLNISEEYEILLVIALGKPKETVVIDEIEADGDIKYWRDENQVHHVPKRKLEDIILKINESV